MTEMQKGKESTQENDTEKNESNQAEMRHGNIEHGWKVRLVTRKCDKKCETEANLEIPIQHNN